MKRAATLVTTLFALASVLLAGTVEVSKDETHHKVKFIAEKDAVYVIEASALFKVKQTPPSMTLRISVDSKQCAEETVTIGSSTVRFTAGAKMKLTKGKTYEIEARLTATNADPAGVKITVAEDVPRKKTPDEA